MKRLMLGLLLAMGAGVAGEPVTVGAITSSIGTVIDSSGSVKGYVVDVSTTNDDTEAFKVTIQYTVVHPRGQHRGTVAMSDTQIVPRSRSIAFSTHAFFLARESKLVSASVSELVDAENHQIPID